MEEVEVEVEVVEAKAEVGGGGVGSVTSRRVVDRVRFIARDRRQYDNSKNYNFSRCTGSTQPLKTITKGKRTEDSKTSVEEKMISNHFAIGCSGRRRGGKVLQEEGGGVEEKWKEGDREQSREEQQEKRRRAGHCVR